MNYGNQVIIKTKDAKEVLHNVTSIDYNASTDKGKAIVFASEIHGHSMKKYLVSSVDNFEVRIEARKAEKFQYVP